DVPNAGIDLGAAGDIADARSAGVAALVRRALVPRLVREARHRGWWDPLGSATAQPAFPVTAPTPPVILPDIDAATWAGLSLEPWVIPPAAPSDGHAIVLAAMREGARVAVALRGPHVVGVAVALEGDLLAVGVAPADRRRGLGRSLLEAVSPALARAEITVAERDPFDPLPI